MNKHAGFSIACMQPYLFPYLGYWQLIASVDCFVILDDVSFIKRGWINRNRIRANGRELTFTLPVRGSSQNRKINELEFMFDQGWKAKFLKTLHMSYGKAPEFESAMLVVQEVMDCQHCNVSDFITNSIEVLCRHFDLSAQIETSSSLDVASAPGGMHRIRAICRKMGAHAYVNPEGGIGLYDRSFFNEVGIELKFLECPKGVYTVNKVEHRKDLSILDLMMHVPPAMLAGWIHQTPRYLSTEQDFESATGRTV